jgi:hypothetical protein
MFRFKQVLRVDCTVMELIHHALVSVAKFAL